MQATNRIQDDASLASRYLAGTLSGAELESYEQYVIQNPEAVQELEATARAKVGLANLRDTGQLDALLKAEPAAPNRRNAILALAASLAIAVIGIGIWQSTSVREGVALMASASGLVDRSGRPLQVGDSYALLRTRASDYDAIVELPVEPRAIELRVRPESSAPLYTVALSRIRADGSVTQIAVLNDLESQADGFVQLYVDSSRLDGGPYLLVISPTADHTTMSTSSFRLKVVRPAALP
jgi:hypothetical protein